MAYCTLFTTFLASNLLFGMVFTAFGVVGWWLVVLGGGWLVLLVVVVVVVL